MGPVWVQVFLYFLCQLWTCIYTAIIKFIRVFFGHRYCAVTKKICCSIDAISIGHRIIIFLGTISNFNKNHGHITFTANTSDIVKINFNVRKNPFGKYSLVTDVSQITSGNNYIISSGKTGRVNVLTNETASNGFGGTQKDVSEYGRITIFEDDASAMPFYLTGSENNCEFFSFNNKRNQ